MYREMVRTRKDRTAGVGIKGQVAELGCEQRGSWSGRLAGGEKSRGG